MGLILMDISKLQLIAIVAAFIIIKIAATKSSKLTTSLKIAQCRAHCLNKFTPEVTPKNGKICKSSEVCSMCWRTCEKLSTDFPIWSRNCENQNKCNVGSGCDTACKFVTKGKAETFVPLSPFKTRLSLVFGQKSAHWKLSWGSEVEAQNTVFALFTKTFGKPWRLKLQTVDENASLNDVKRGTLLQLVAVADFGLLSVIITPFEPPPHTKNEIYSDFPLNYPWNKEKFSENTERKSWPLNYEASVQDSGLVTAKIKWESLMPYSDYHLTWEVSSGGLKGHLYTDIPEAELKLEPDTTYNIQVEEISGPINEPRVSQMLTLDTKKIVFDTNSEILNTNALDTSTDSGLFKDNLAFSRKNVPFNTSLEAFDTGIFSNPKPIIVKLDDKVLTLENQRKLSMAKVINNSYKSKMNSDKFQPLIEPHKNAIEVELVIGSIVGILSAIFALVSLIIIGRRLIISRRLNESTSSTSKLSLKQTLSPNINFEESGKNVGKISRNLNEAYLAVNITPHSVQYPGLHPQNTLGIPSSQNVYVHHPTIYTECEKR